MIARLQLANGLIWSRLHYLIAIWGGAPSVNLDKLQTIINKAARFMLGRGQRANVRKLMVDCGWMYVKEAVVYHTLLAGWRIVHLGVPSLVARKITVSPDLTLATQRPRLKATETGFRNRLVNDWNLTPISLREISVYGRYRARVKRWLLATHGPDAD